MPLHPQAQAFVDELAAQNPPSWEDMTPRESREMFSSFTHLFGTGPALHRVENRQVAGGVSVRVYSPVDDDRLPVILYFHGGGWLLGNLDTHDALSRRLAKESGCVVVTVDYPLAPENKYPAALEDCYAATSFVANHGGDFGVDASRLAVVGDSAGGNLAAGVTLKARAAKGPAIRFQVLIYPVVAPNFETSSYQVCGTGHGLTRASMRYFWEQYLGDTKSDKRYVKIAQARLHDLPAAHVVTAEYDVLRDEGEDYAARLSAAGVPTTTKRYDGMLHGFVHFNGIFDDGLTALSDIALVLRKSLFA